MHFRDRIEEKRKNLGLTFPKGSSIESSSPFQWFISVGQNFNLFLIMCIFLFIPYLWIEKWHKWFKINQKLWKLWQIMVFCYQNCSDLVREKIVLVIEKNFWNSRLKAENLQKFWDHWSNLHLCSFMIPASLFYKVNDPLLQVCYKP